MLNKFRTLVLVVILAIFATQATADNNFATPDDNCPDNLTLLPAGTDVYFAPYTQQGEVSNGFVDQDVLTNFHTFVMNSIQNQLPVASLLISPENPTVIGEAPTPIRLTGNYVCPGEDFIVILREASVNGQLSWVIEKVILEELGMTDAIIEQFTIELLEVPELAPENNGQLAYDPAQLAGNSQAILQAPDTIPVLSNARFNLWQIYNVVAVDTAEELLAPDPLPQNYCGEYAAPSYLSVGMQAQMNTYQYTRFPSAIDLNYDSDETWVELGDAIYDSPYYAQDFLDRMSDTPVYLAPFDSFVDVETAVTISQETLWAPPVYGAPIVTIADGPYCGEGRLEGDLELDYTNSIVCAEAGNPMPLCGFSDHQDHLYTTWWKIEVTLHGQAYQGWYPENATVYAWWLYELEGKFDQVATAYLLTPYGEAMSMMDEDDCDPLPGSRFAAGTDVQPASSAMNIRDDANGSVIGRVEMPERMTLVGEGDCEEGVRWREVIFHGGSVPSGWIAENDATNFYIAPYVPTVETVEPEATRPADSGQPTGSNNDSRPQSTPEPGTARPTAQPTPLTATLVIATSTCNPTTGRGC